MNKQIYRDKNNKEIKEGCIVKTRGNSRGDYSVVTKYKNKLYIFGNVLSAWVFLANKNWQCPYLTVVGKI